MAEAEAKLRSLETTRAEAVKDFLLSLFLKNTRLQPDPAAARAMTVTELLRSSAQKLRQGFRDQPQLKVELLATVGTMLADLEDYTEAIELFREADALMQTTGNILPDAQFGILHQRIMLAARMGAAEEALQIRQRMHALLAPPNRPTDLLKIKVYSVFLGSGLDDPKGIEAQLKMAIELAEGGFRDQPEYFMALYGLGYHYYSISDYASAEPVLRKAVDAFAASGSKDFRFHAQAKSQLANVMAARGRIRDSIPIMEEAANDIRTRFGADSTRSRVFASIYAGVLANHGRTTDAARILGAIATPAAALKTGEKPAYPALFASAYEAQMLFAMGDMKGVIRALTRYPEQFNLIARVEPNVAAGQSLLEAQAWEMLGARAKADAAMNRVAQVNEGKTYEFFAKSPPYLMAAARIAGHRRDYAKALALLAVQGSAAGPATPLPPAFNEDFTNFNILAAENLAASGDLAAAAETARRTRVHFEKHAALADYPFLAATLLSTEGRIAALQGNFPDCIAKTREALAIQQKTHAPSSTWMAQTIIDSQRCEAKRIG